MNCKRCGKAIGTDRGICPFCGAMLSQDQMATYKQMKKENRFHEEMITEKYNGKKVYYEKREGSDSNFYLWIILFGLLIIIAIVVLVIVLGNF